MNRIIKKITRPIREFWMSEFKIKGKKFYYGTIISALIIVAITIFVFYFFGLVGLLILVLKNGVRWTLGIMAKMTLRAFVIIGIKRFVIDFMIMPIMKRHVFAHVIPAMIARLKHSKSSLVRWLAISFGGLFALGVAIFSFFANGWALLQASFALIASKLAASFGFKTIWALFAGGWSVLINAWVFIKTTPFGILIQVYVLSWIMDIFGKMIPKRAKNRLKPIGNWLINLFWKFQRLLDRLFGFHLERTMKRFASWLEPKEARKKQNYERLLLALERKKQQKQKHPSDGAQIRGFDAHRAGKHIPSRNQQKKR